MSEPVTLDAKLLTGFPLPHHAEESDKEDRGRLLAVAGSKELAGAALLAGVCALRVGAGKLQIATAASISVQLGVAVPEARVIGLEETDDGCIAESEIERLIGWARGAQAVLLGCGLQEGAPLDSLVDQLLEARLDIPLILDAAVLGTLKERAQAVQDWPGGVAVLPHPGETAKLLDWDRERVADQPLAAAREAAQAFGAVALVKGPFSHIVTPDGQAFRYKGGGVGLATSGSGDTLAGIVGGLAARGADPLTATLWGVYLHGEAGRLLTERVGRIGFLAREIPELLPGLMQG